MKTTTFASATRRATITDLAPEPRHTIDLYAGTSRVRTERTLSWSHAVRVAKAWVGAQGRVIA